MDNWFSSPDLYEKLCSKQINAMETFHQNKNSVLAELKVKLKKREHVGLHRQTDNDIERQKLH
jgi:hypothetical protein